MASIFERLDSKAGIETENGSARFLERTAFVFLILMTISAPHSIAASQASWILGMLATALRFFIRPRPKFRFTALSITLVALFVWSAISSVFSYEPAISLDKLRNVSLLLVFFFAFLNLRRLSAVYLVAFLLILSTLVNVAWAIGTRLCGRGVEIHGLAPEGPLARSGVPDGATLVSVDGKKVNSPDELIAALSSDAPSKLLVYEWESYRTIDLNRNDLMPGGDADAKLGIANWSRSYNWRAQGFFGHFTTYAEALQLIASLLFGIVVATLSRPRDRSGSGLLNFFTSTPAMIAALAAILVALLLTVTRASQLAFMVSAFVAIVMSGSRKLLLAAAILAVPVVLGGLLFLQQSRNVGLIDPTDESTLYRITMWKDGLRLSTADAHNLVFGIGMDSTKKHWQEWGMFRGGFMPFGHFHSTPLQMLVERGIPAFLLWLAVLFFYGWTLLQAIRRIKRDPETSRWTFGILLGCLGGLAGFFVSGLVHYNLGDGEVALIFYLLMGVGIETAQLISNDRQVETIIA
jgi:O-antigen ligase